MKTTETIV